MSTCLAAPNETHDAGPALRRPVFTPRWERVAGELLFGPSGIVPLGDGQTLLVDECHHSLVVVDEEGHLVQRLGREGAEPGAFRYPTQAVVDGRGGIWVTDRWNHRVQHLTLTGEVLGVFGAYGRAPGTFNEPWGITVLDGERLVVADRCNHRLQVFRTDGELVATLGRGGYDRAHYEGRGFKSGYVYQRWLGQADRFSRLDTLFREQGYTLGTLEHPQGLVAISGDRILIADPGIGAVLVCSLATGEVEPFAASNGLRFSPTNVCALGDGLVAAVADAGRTLCLLDEQGGRRFSNVPGIEHLTSCATGPDATLWCLDGWNSRLVCYNVAFEPDDEEAS
ncbi:MAG: NHL repeat-containing protein [Verrucomicrobia bacterium]|nr:NHL repeat-containing protein [Verrucomicrobiota bacterium]